MADRRAVRGSSAGEVTLPPSVQTALGELVNAPKDELPASGSASGSGVMHEVLEREITEIVRPEGPP